MQYVELGKTGLKISRLGFGGIPIQQVNQEEADRVIRKAVELGINFFDTARGYTESEKLIGNALAGMRDKVYLASKSMARDKSGMLKDVDITLENLKTDYIDLYQLHNISSTEELDKVLSDDGAYQALVEMKEKGKVKHIGITSHNLKVIEKVLDMNLFETIQYPFSVVERQAEVVFKKAVELNIGTIAMKPLAGGALRNPIPALKYIFENPYVSCAIPGMDTVEKVEENARALEGDPLTDEEREKLLKEAETLGQTFCRRCGYCMPCPVGINIPAVFLMEGYYTRYDLVDWALTRYNAMPVKADACEKCGLCESRCPYNLPIREMLENAKKVLKY